GVAMSFRHFDVDAELQKLRVPPAKVAKVAKVATPAAPAPAGAENVSRISDFSRPPSRELHIPSWFERAVDLIRWFQTHRPELPTEEFYLNPWTKVSEPPLFYDGLAREIAAGPRGPRAEALVDDLEQLFERWSIRHEEEAGQ